MNSLQRTGHKIPNIATIVRRAGVVDVDEILELAKGISTVARWSRGTLELYCATGLEAEAQAKALFVSCLTPPQETPISARRQIVGFAAFSAILQAGGGECELENMAVAEPWRRQGNALRLLAAGLLWCRAWCPADAQATPQSSGLRLEVRASNLAAIHFYQCAGFEVNGRRPGYYTHPDDDAILMWKSLDGSH